MSVANSYVPAEADAYSGHSAYTFEGKRTLHREHESLIKTLTTSDQVRKRVFENHMIG